MALYTKISSRSRIPRRGICYSVALITAGTPKNPRNPAPGGTPGLKRTRVGALFKKFFMKTIVKSKINLIRKVLNFVSIQ
jgi:hypothetical protein